MNKIGTNLETTVRYLAQDIGPRSYRDRANLARAASFIESQFRCLDYRPARQTYDYRGNSYCNIVAEAAGLDSYRSDILVVGAHYDTARDTPGADDNASGIAVLLELARHLANHPISRTVHLLAFTLEEPPAFFTRNMGSFVYATSLKRAGAQVHGMICLEMLGYFSDRRKSQFPFPFSFLRWFYPVTADFIALIGNLASRPFATTFRDCFKKASTFPVETLNTPSLVPGVCFSDHLNFWRCGYPALMITDTAFMRNKNYHRKTDTADTLDYGRMAELVSGLASALLLLP